MAIAITKKQFLINLTGSVTAIPLSTKKNKRYPGAEKDNIIKAYKTNSYTSASDAGLLKSNQIMVESAGVSTLTGVDLDDVSGGTYVGATNSGSTSTPSSFNYMIKDDNGSYIDAGNSNYSTHFAAAAKNSDGTYSYNGEVLSNDNLYVISLTDRYGDTTSKVGVFLTSSGKVYTGKVFGANNEVLMTTKNDDGTLYSYWGADTPDPNSKLADMTIGQFNQALEKVNNNSKAVAGDTIKEIKTTAKTDGGGTIDLIRRGQYNSATGQYEGEHKVGSGITITSRGGTNGKDVKINFSNGTTGVDVAAGSKVEAVGTQEATTGLTINGKTYNIKTGQNYTSGDNVSISADNVISATNTTLVAGDAEKKGDSYIVKDTAGNKVTLKDVASAATVTQNYNTLNTKVEAAKTTLANGTNTTVESSTVAEDGHTEYKVNLNEKVNLGDTIQLNGSDGSISAKSGGAKLSFNNNGLTVSQAKNGVTNETRINGAEITVDGGIGNQTTIKGSMASIGSVLVNGGGGTATISGLTNKTTKYAGFATSGRAATEEQLKEVSGQASEAITKANKGWNLTTNGAAASKTNIAPDGTVDFSSDDGNLVISNAGVNLSFALNKDIKVDSITAKTDGGQLNIKSEVNMNNQKITNLANGEIAKGSKDAVNGGQIYDLKQNVSTNTENINILNEAVVANAENINSLSHSLNKLDSRINRVGAGAAALAVLHPLDFDPDNKWDFAAGYGNYAGANAVAIGTYYRPNENTMFSIGGSFGGGENMINAGVSFKLGSGSSGITTSKTVMAKKIKEQDELLKAQDAKMKEQDEKIAKLEALVAQQGEMIRQALGKK